MKPALENETDCFKIRCNNNIPTATKQLAPAVAQLRSKTAFTNASLPASAAIDARPKGSYSESVLDLWPCLRHNSWRSRFFLPLFFLGFFFFLSSNVSLEFRHEV